MIKKLTLRDLHKVYSGGKKIAALSVYDTIMARIADETGIHVVLVGDSMGMTILGYENTLAVTLEQSLHHTAAVARGVSRAMVIGDMPFLSFQVNDDETIRNAGRYLQEAGADGIKLEGGKDLFPIVSRLTKCGIPVMGHIGILPQRVIIESGYRLHGKTKSEAALLLDDAKYLQDAGVFSLILEGVPSDLGREITESVDIPTIGIGAGPHCSGQIQVAHDILGMLENFVPKHTKRYAELAKTMRCVFSQYKEEVQDLNFPGEEQSF